MLKIATVRDAGQLSVLNDDFNGKDETTIDNIRVRLFGIIFFLSLIFALISACNHEGNDIK